MKQAVFPSKNKTASEFFSISHVEIVVLEEELF